MKPSYTALFVVIGTLTVGMSAAPAPAQTAAPSATEMERALRPIPKALQGGSQGIGAGAVVRFPSERPTAAAAMTVPAFGPRRTAAAAATGVPSSLPRCAPPTMEPGTLSLPQITFDFDSAALRPEARKVLEDLGTALNRGLIDQKLFVLEGHTDVVGSAEYNEKLSLRRAEAAKTFLVEEMKVDPARLQAVGKGWDGLADPCRPRAAENRRIVVVNPARPS